MKTVTQTILYRQALINYSQKYGVTKAAIRYKTNRQYIYRWQGRYDGTWHIYDLTNTKSGSIAGRINGLERPESNEGYALTNDASTDIISTSEEKNQENSEQAEESLFTEPDKREINENMINGRGLNIVQEHIEETAKKLDPGIVIKWDPNLDKGGSFNPYSKVLTLRANLTTAEAYIEIFKHEFMHDLELRGGYDKFLKFLENKSEAFAQYAKNVLKEYDRKYTGGNAGTVKALFDLYYEKYTTDERIMPVARKAFTLEDAKREAAADFFADVLFKGKEYRSEIATALKYDNELPEGSYETSLSALEEIAHKDKNLFHRIIEAVKRFISNIKGNKTTRKLEADLARLERKLQDVYESAETKKTTEDGGVKFMLGVTQDDINKYVENAKKKENTDDYKKYAPVSEKLVNDVKDEIDLSGYTHALRDNDIRHILHSHGENTNEKYPVTEQDIERVPFIVQNYDKIFYNKYKGNDSLIYVKAFKSGITYYVEQATDKYGNEDLLVNKQMIKTGIDDVPSIYKDIINQKEGIVKFLADLEKVHREYAQSVINNPSNNIISTPDTKSQENISDGEKFSLRGDRLEELIYQRL